MKKDNIIDYKFGKRVLVRWYPQKSRFKCKYYPNFGLCIDLFENWQIIIGKFAELDD